MPIYFRVRAILNGLEFSIGEEHENEAKEIKDKACYLH
jgi:hypothetical protein